MHNVSAPSSEVVFQVLVGSLFFIRVVSVDYPPVLENDSRTSRGNDVHSDEYILLKMCNLVSFNRNFYFLTYFNHQNIPSAIISCNIVYTDRITLFLFVIKSFMCEKPELKFAAEKLNQCLRKRGKSKMDVCLRWPINFSALALSLLPLNSY